MDSSLGIKLVEQPQQPNHHQQPPIQQTQQHPHNKNNNNDITNNTGVVGSGDHASGTNIILSNNERIHAAFPNTIKRPPTQDFRTTTKITPKYSITLTKSNNTQRNQSTSSNTPPLKTLAKINTSAKTVTTRKITPHENVVGRMLNTKDVDSFFARCLHNSYQATDELIKSIEESQDETLARRVLNLYQLHYSTLERPWDHETFMYGLGLIYMHFNAYNWAIKSLRDTVYAKPYFPKSRDIHTRLGLIFKTTGRYRLSEKHFNLAINDSRRDSGTSTKLELRFHLAHLSELQGKTKEAIKLYEELLQEKDLPDKLSANIHRNLGWIHYSNIPANSVPSCKTNSKHDSKSSKGRLHDNIFGQGSLIEPRKLDTALNHLRTSYNTDSDSQTSYYLGRCLTNIGKFQDAFAFYRSVIDKEESTADTWCSIGVLYQRENQPLDALQAYIRSVQYDKKHSVAWMNLGILYETHHQFKDALKCYRHVLRSSSTCRDDGALQTRINYIQKHLADIEASLSNSGKPDISSDKLLSLEDLWNMESKTNQESYLSSTSNINGSDTSQNAPSAAQPQIKPEIADHPTKQTKAQNNMTAPMEVDNPRMCNGQTVNQKNQSTTTSTKTTQGLDPESTNSRGAAIHLESTHSAPKQPQSGQIHPEDKLLPNNNLNGLQVSISDDCKPTVTNQPSQEIKPLPLDSKDICLNQLFTNGASKDSGISSDSSTYADCTLVPSQSTDINLTSYISAEKVLETCNEISTSNMKKIDISLLCDEFKHPSSCLRQPIYPPLPANALSPVPPSVILDSKRELGSKRLQDICLSNPISIVRNMASVLKLDLGLFSTRTLVESNPDQQIDILGHTCPLDIDSGGKDEKSSNSWLCERHQSTSTISRYASYQVSSFRQSAQEERDRKSKSHPTKESETDSNESASNKKSNADGPSSSRQPDSLVSNFKSSPSAKTKSQKECPKMKYVKSAHMIDLSDDKKWRPQIHELNKLPHFLKCVSASNMLTHIGTAIPGLNTITMSMHVPGCKIVSSRIPSQFCSVHISTGPGDYEWCAISAEYECVLRKICNRNGLDMDQQDWWPILGDLQKYRIPVYRFAQRPGDLVWINSGTLYWVQATGWANNIHWNLGPLCARQYQLASESCEFDKLLFRRSAVPMIQMTWNIIMNISIIADDELFRSMVNVLRRSLRYCKLVGQLIQESNNSVMPSNDEPGPRSAKYCSLCEIEIFNITFESKQKDESIHCVECARRADSTFKSYKMKQEYEMKFLMEIYDNFVGMKKKFQVKQMQMRRKNRQQQ